MNQVSSSNQPSQTSKPRSYTPALLVMLVVVSVAALGLVYRQRIADQITVWQFQPSREIVELANRASLNDEGKFYLYASRAELNNRDEFNQACGSLQNEKTVVVGCYTGSLSRTIHVYDVSDKRLDGVKETTTAHEMLHAAYDRLGDTERRRVNSWLRAEKAKVTDERLKSIIKHYEEAEPDAVDNELHSIFGTEVRQLSPELEKYYSRYFSNRHEVVALKEKYEAVFTEITNHQDRLVAEMNALAAEIDSRNKAYATTLSNLNADIASFNAWANSGSATRSEYNSQRVILQSRVNMLDAERDAINALIDTYNAKKKELDEVSLQATELNKSIDSKLEFAPSI